jgi:hypothetical protein
LKFQEEYQLSYAADGGRIGYEIGGDIDPADLPMSKEGFPRYEDESGEEVEYPYENQRNGPLLQTLMQNYFKCI